MLSSRHEQFFLIVEDRRKQTQRTDWFLVSRNDADKNNIKHVPFKELGDPVVVYVPLSQVTWLLRLLFTQSYVAYTTWNMLLMILLLFTNYFHRLRVRVSELHSAIMNLPGVYLQLETREFNISYSLICILLTRGYEYLMWTF